jgi:hypothetical protein
VFQDQAKASAAALGPITPGPSIRTGAGGCHRGECLTWAFLSWESTTRLWGGVTQRGGAQLFPCEAPPAEQRLVILRSVDLKRQPVEQVVGRLICLQYWPDGAKEFTGSREGFVFHPRLIENKNGKKNLKLKPFHPYFHFFPSLSFWRI